MDGQFCDLLNAKIDEWMTWDKNENTRQEVKMLVENKDETKLKALMLQRLLFGTAGLRGRMGAGYSCMNDLVVIQTSQGIGKYLLSSNPDAKKKGIVIGYDSRHNSTRFARLAASSFLSCGIPVYLLGRICPTPFVPFTVVQYDCAAGVMVTASHNPKEDNGYKVYWNNGAQGIGVKPWYELTAPADLLSSGQFKHQPHITSLTVRIIPPHDKNIQQSIEEHLEPFSGVWDLEKCLSNPLLSDPIEDISEKYFKALSSSVLDSELNGNTPLKFTLTAMHGVSHLYMVKAFEVCNFKPFVPVKEQMEPDPEFPTVKFPNPEEGKSALDLSFATANANNSSIILANDPDADRLAVAEKLKTGEWKVFTGNEEGALLGWWAWHRCRILNPEIPLKDIYMIASTVSSKILRAIASVEGFNFVETLTGFKWMGNKAYSLKKEGKTVLFAFEEAIGFMNGCEVLDKDGVSAAIRISEMASYLQTQGMTLVDKLHDIYKTYGFHGNNNSYYICKDQAIILKMFERIRNYDGSNTYPRSVKNGKYTVKDIRDLTTGYDSSQNDKRAVLPSSSDCQMITFSFTNNCIITLRTSGTEPKIKYYSEIYGSAKTTDWNQLAEELKDLVDAVVEEFMEPKKNNLIPKPE